MGLVDGTRILVPRDHTDRLHRPDELVDLLRTEQVLLDLVVDDAVSGLVDSQLGERPGVRRHRGSHRVNNGVDPLLAELGQLEPRLLGPLRERPCFGNRREIAISIGRDGFCHDSSDTKDTKDTKDGSSFSFVSLVSFVLNHVNLWACGAAE